MNTAWAVSLVVVAVVVIGLFIVRRQGADGPPAFRDAEEQRRSRRAHGQYRRYLKRQARLEQRGEGR